MLKTTACTLLITISLVGCASKEPKPDVWPQIIAELKRLAGR